jgi:hypothetical protein
VVNCPISSVLFTFTSTSKFPLATSLDAFESRFMGFTMLLTANKMMIVPTTALIRNTRPVMILILLNSSNCSKWSKDNLAKNYLT